MGGVLGTTSVLGFGSSVTGISLVGGTIDTTTVGNMAFSMPRDGVITSIAAYFSTTLGVSLIGSDVTVEATLYSSTTPDNVFAPIALATVTLAPAFNGLIAIGDIADGITTGLSIPVTAGTRLLLVFSASVTDGIDIAATLTGYASAGVAIS
nr:exosporium glycoprotein BclB-related protein [Konateibacter massiliensis]